jgi:hypothetical protein
MHKPERMVVPPPSPDGCCSDLTAPDAGEPFYPGPCVGRTTYINTTPATTPGWCVSTATRLAETWVRASSANGVTWSLRADLPLDVMQALLVVHRLNGDAALILAVGPYVGALP